MKLSSMGAAREFRDLKRVNTDPVTEVCTAVDAGDGRPVLLKRYAETELGRRAFDVELEYLSALAGAGVPGILDRITEDRGRVLVLRCPAGVPLSKLVSGQPMSVELCVAVAIKLASLLGRIHEARAMHLGMRPQIIFVDPATTETQVVDFSCVRRSTMGSGDVEAMDASKNDPVSWRFVSPEQTGRMARGVDSRSDLFSLGACMYFMATGCAPFELDDPLALVHALIAREPRPVSELRPDFPPVLARVIAKLLEKTPESRYQTAVALERDLERCRAEFLTSGPTDFALGTADGPYRPLFSGELYGRDADMRVLETAWARANDGEGCIVFVSGAEGIGKSALVAALRPGALGSRAFMADGRCERSRADSLFWAVAGALGTVVQQLLAQREELLEAWRLRMREGLGSVAGALVGVIPDLDLLLPGIDPAVALHPGATFARLALAVQRFVRTLAGSGHPLLLWLDDLQWIDAGSRDLLAELLRQETLPYVLFVGSYRVEESDTDAPASQLAAWLEDGPLPATVVSLAPISRVASARMLAEALGRSESDVMSLAECVERKTANSPLLIRQFIDHCYELGMMRFQDGTGWIWDEGAIEDLEVGEAAVDLLSTRIERLSASSVRVLEVGACMGEAFGVENLAAILGDGLDDLEVDLVSLRASGLLLDAAEGLRFVHDRIRQAALQRLSAGRRAEIHEAIARWMLAHAETSNSKTESLEIADHVNNALERMSETDRKQVIEINATAGAAALSAGAGPTALHYLDVALEHFSAEDFESYATLGFQLHLDAADAACQTGDYARALQLLAPLADRTWSCIDEARIGAKQIQVYTMRESEIPHSRPLLEILQVLRRHGMHTSIRPPRWLVRILVWYTDRILAGPLDEQSLRHATSDPSRFLPRVLLISAAAPVLQLESGLYVCWHAAIGLCAFKKHGYLGTPALLIAAYGNYRRIALRNLRGMERYAEAALYFAERSRDPTVSVRTRFVVAAFMHAWTRPRRSVISELGGLCDEARELGDLEFALFSASQRANYVALTGTPLPEVELELRSVGERSGRAATQAFGIIAEACDFLVARLADRGLVADKATEIDAVLASQPASRMACWAFWQTLLIVLGCYIEAEAFARSVSSWCFVSGASSCSQLADYVFMRGLCAGMLRDRDGAGLPRAELRTLRRTVLRSEREVRRWARDGEDFRHMALALRGERVLVRGRVVHGVRFLSRASDQAARIGYVHHAALLRERLAQLLELHGRRVEAAVELRRAAAFYEEWGASAKARALLTRLHGHGEDLLPAKTRA